MSRARAWSFVVAILGILALVLWMLTTTAERYEDRATAEAPVERSTPVELASAAPLADTPTDRQPATQLETTPVADSNGTEVAPAPARLVRVGARLVDERGAPVGSGRLTVWLVDGERSAESRADGEVELEFDLGTIRGPRFGLEATAPGRVRRRSANVERTTLEERDSLYLGEIVLGPGGALEGRVIDESGTPIADATLVPTRPISEPTADQVAGWRLWLPYSDLGNGIRPTTKSGADGRYRLEGIPPGRVTLFAGDYRHLTDREEDLEVRAGGTTGVRDLVLRSPEDGVRIGGVVIGADGQPFPGAYVRLLDEEESRIYGSQASTDRDGRFEMLAVPGLTYAIRAYDPSNMRSVKKLGVRAGDHELELRFGAVGVLEVSARDDLGPVENFQVYVRDADDRVVARGAAQSGLARVDLPAPAVGLQVIGPVHRLREVGPLVPEQAPARLDVVLERAGGIAGAVLAEGRPVPGADVHAHGKMWQGEIGVYDEGLVTLVDPFVRARVRTDEDGRYFLPLQPGRYRLHAEAPGRGRSGSDWLEVVGNERIEGIELALPASGAIDGRVLTAPGVEARGIRIGAGCGDGHVLLTHTEGEGRFRFEDLPPGSWQVRRLPANSSFDQESYRPAREGHEVRWDVVVSSGRTTPFLIDARDELPCSLEGRLTFGGAVPAGWSAMLWSTSTDTQTVMLDGVGRFTLRAVRPERAWLSFQSPGTAIYSRLSLEIEIQPGANLREIDVPAGSLILENLPGAVPVAGQIEPRCVLSWSDGSLRWRLSIQECPDGRAVLDHVPAGKLVLRCRGEQQSTDDSSWPVKAEIELAVGENRVVELR